MLPLQRIIPRITATFAMSGLVPAEFGSTKNKHVGSNPSNREFVHNAPKKTSADKSGGGDGLDGAAKKKKFVPRQQNKQS
jgi:hypothetical protein